MRIGQWDSATAADAYVIAEIGVNHNGDLSLAHEMIDIASDAGANCAKFQTFHADQFCGDPTEMFSYVSQGVEVTESMRDMFRRFELPDDSWDGLAKHCKDRGVDFMTTPQDLSDLKLVSHIDLPAIKVGSDDLVNTWLISRYRDAGLPIILSSGMADIDEVELALTAAGWPESGDVAVLVCTSTYPTPPNSANLGRISTLKRTFPGLIIGFSDHTEGAGAATVARTLGAVIFEKHFTTSHDLPGPDHWFSADPSDLREWIDAIRNVDVLLGDGVVRPTDAEHDMRRLARRAATALQDIAPDEVLTEANVGLRRPALGIPPRDFEALLGKRATRAIKAWEPIREADAQLRGAG